MTNLQKALEISKLSISLTNQKRIFQEEYDLSLFYFVNNGVFKATRELISYVKTIQTLSKDEQIVILDENNVPIKIENINIFLNSLVDVHIQANNKFFARYQQLENENTLGSILK